MREDHEGEGRERKREKSTYLLQKIIKRSGVELRVQLDLQIVKLFASLIRLFVSCCERKGREREHETDSLCKRGCADIVIGGQVDFLIAISLSEGREKGSEEQAYDTGNRNAMHV